MRKLGLTVCTAASVYGLGLVGALGQTSLNGTVPLSLNGTVPLNLNARSDSNSTRQIDIERDLVARARQREAEEQSQFDFNLRAAGIVRR